jgi:cation/acetate symporter
VIVLAILEQMGLSRQWIGFIFLIATVALYAGIGVMSRTSDASEYYVAGRRVPALYNGMATGADWMSAASFIGMAGTLYLSGYGGLAFIMGWTGGYCLVALFLAPYLRKFGQFTIPDFLGARYEGNLPRLIGILAAILCSFTYVVAQIYGVGLITTRLSGLAFEIGIFVGLGGILVCSFLGGMRAVTWTQVAQYIILIIAYMIPVVWLSVKQTGVPIPQAIYGYQLQKVTEAEKKLRRRPQGKGSHRRLQGQGRRIRRQAQGRARRAGRRQGRRREEGGRPEGRQRPGGRGAGGREGAGRPAEGRSRGQEGLDRGARPTPTVPSRWPACLRMRRSSPATPRVTRRRRRPTTNRRRNFLALAFCLMVGTAALPHILMRYYTTPSVKEARESVTWSLFFIFLLYFTAPALAVLVKYEVFTVLVGTPFDKLPAWIANWSRVDPALLSVVDINKDGIFQLGEMKIGGDIIVLATPEIGGLPYVVSGMVAAGGLAAALSTADGLLLTIANALSHDLYYKMIDPNAPTARRVAISKALLLVVALAAAYVAAQKPADILFLVSAAFSFAAAAFFPALTLGMFWKRANKWGASLGMIAGLGITFYYMVTTQPWLRGIFGVTSPVELWWGIQPISAGIFGVPLGFAVIIIVSLLTPAPKQETQELVEHVRYPDLKLAKA